MNTQTITASVSLLGRAFIERQGLGFVTDDTRTALTRAGFTADAIECYLNWRTTHG